MHKVNKSQEKIEIQNYCDDDARVPLMSKGFAALIQGTKTEALYYACIDKARIRWLYASLFKDKHRFKIASVLKIVDILKIIRNFIVCYQSRDIIHLVKSIVPMGFGAHYLQEKVSHLNNRLTTNDLVHAKSLLIRMGCFTEALYFRNIALDSVLKHYEVKRDKCAEKYIYMAFFGYMERYRLQEASNLLLEHESMFSRNPYIFPWIFLLQRELTSPHLKNLFFNQLAKEPRLISFKIKSLVAGKRVALVGPAKRGKELGYEIDEAELVVRMNLMHPKDALLQKNEGSRTDLIYVRPYLLRNHPPASMSACASYGDARLIVSDEIFYEDLVACRDHDIAPPENLEEIFEQHTPAQFAGFSETFNFGPRVVADLLLHGASEVLVYYTDLRLSREYQSGYTPITETSQQEIDDRVLEDMASLDPFTAFNYFQSLYRCKLITGGRDFSAIIKSGIDQYAARMDDIYSDAREKCLTIKTS